MGSCLSGGLDSSAIVATIDHLRRAGGQTPPDGRQLTFSSVFHEPARYNERPFVDAVLGQIPAKGVMVFPTSEDLDRHLDEVVRCQDEPFGDLSIYAQWCIMRAVKDHGVGVLLDGQGADEILGGYTPFATNVSELLRRCDASGVIRELRALRRAGHAGLSRLALSALIRQLPARMRMVVGRRRWRNVPAMALLAPELRGEVCAKDVMPYGFAEDQLSLSRLLRFQVEEGVLPTLLRYEDRNSAAFGLEGRVPFLDHRVVEFAFSTGAPLRLREGWTKWLLRMAFADVLPTSVIWRKSKVGFGVPGVRWLGHLIRANPETLGPASPAGEFLDLDHARRLSTGLGRDSSAHAPMWRCLNVEKWLRSWQQAPQS